LRVTPVTTRETTSSGLERYVKRCPKCGWFFDVARPPLKTPQPAGRP
jgi:hypothetical protein